MLARRREVRKQAKEDGFYAVDFCIQMEEAMGAAMLVNTVLNISCDAGDHQNSA